MRFVISVSDLQYAIQSVRDVVPTSATIVPEARGIKIAVKGNRATFTAFSPEMSTKVTVNIEGKEDGEAAISATALHSAISKFKPLNDKGVGTSPIKISTNSVRKLVLSAKTFYSEDVFVLHRKLFPLQNLSYFPQFPEIESDIKLTLPAAILMDAVEAVMYATATNKVSPVYTGVLLHLENKKLTTVSTDGICIAEYTCPVAYEGPSIKVIIPKSFAVKLAKKSFFDSDIVEVALTDKKIFISTPNLTMGGVLIGGVFPDYKSVIPNIKTYVTVDKYILRDGLSSLAYETSLDKEFNRISLSFADKQLLLKSQGSSNSGIETDFEGELKVDFNSRLLGLSLGGIEGNAVRFGFCDSHKLIQFSPIEEKGYGLKTALVLLAPQ